MTDTPVTSSTTYTNNTTTTNNIISSNSSSSSSSSSSSNNVNSNSNIVYGTPTSFITINSNPLLNTVEDNDLLVKSVAEGYSNYLGFSSSTNEQAKNIDDTIENMLARLDEFGAFVETIKTDTEKTESKLIPLLYEKTLEVQQLFPIIDKLLELSSGINKNITILEDRLNQADKHVSNLTGKSNPLKWVLSHIGQKEEDILQQIKNSQDLANSTPQLKFEPLKIHNTNEFFKQVRNDAQPQNNNNNNSENNNITKDEPSSDVKKE